MKPRLVTVRNGLDVPLDGAPEQRTHACGAVNSVALVLDDHRLRRPSCVRSIGEHVRFGESVVEDLATPGVILTAPATGTVSEIERGERRSLRAVVIEPDATDESPGTPVCAALRRDEVAHLTGDALASTLLRAGLWPALRTRPFRRVPTPGSTPHAIFVTATDSEPLAPRPDVVIAEHADEFDDGVTALSALTPGPVYVCVAAGHQAAVPRAANVRVIQFAGPHPAGLVGTHIHLLDPCGQGREVWHIGYQDAISIGRLVRTGHPWAERVVSLAGPAVLRPRLLRTRLGANILDLVRGELREGTSRVISGSALAGRQASGWGRHLGRFHRQICAIPEPPTPPHAGPWTTAVGGRSGPMIPVEDFERVLPLDLLVGPLLRALVVDDHERARDLGCLELDEEDLALCTYVCPGKLEYGPLLARTLDRLEIAP